MNYLLGWISLTEVALLVAVVLVCLVLTPLLIWMLIVCIQRLIAGDQRQIPWLVALLMTSWIGAGLYWFFVHRRYVPPKPKSVATPAAPSPAGSAGRCPHCGKPLTEFSVQGICPECLFQAGLGTQGPDGGDARFTAPTLEELQPLFPQLELIQLLGRGGMGAVYQARQKELNRFVALKVLPSARAERDPAFAERFAREARALASLNHPNIVTVYDHGQTAGHCWLLMEYVDGLSLRQLLQRGTMKPEEAVAIVPHICEALQFAHQHGIVHRDIKPENLLVDTRGRVKIADFGIAKIIGVETERTHLTEPKQTLGTPHYMAPEQVEKPSLVDHRADIYSLGVVFYEMLTGELPLGKFASPSQKVQVDVRLDEIVLRALEKEPARRYQQASQVKTAVEGMGASQPKQTRLSHRRMPESVDYRSTTRILGLPLVHICRGEDPATGEPRTARGILAIGDRAVGVLAFGGRATGLIAFGGLAMGGFAFGGCALGAVSLGGCALGLLGASGGFAMAPIAFGGMAVGWFAGGGGAFGIHAYGGNVRSETGRAVFGPLLANGPGGIRALMSVYFVLMLMAIGVPWIAGTWLKVQTGRIHRAWLAILPALLLFLGTAVVTLPVVLGSQAPDSGMTWSPPSTNGSKPSLDEIAAEARNLAKEGNYAEALKRQLWLHRFGAKTEPSYSGVRLSFWLNDWVELSRVYPPAREALIQTRDKVARQLTEGRGLFEHFQEVSSLNEALLESQATMALFKQLHKTDPKRAQIWSIVVEDLLLRSGEYSLALDCLGPHENRFRSLVSAYGLARQFDAENIQVSNPSISGVTIPPKPPLAAQRFSKGLGTFLEILLANNLRTKAEAFHQEALKVLDTPEIRSALTDAETRIENRLRTAPYPTPQG